MSLLPAAAHMLITSPSSSSPSCEHAAARTIWTLAGCAELRNSRGSVALFTHPNIDARRQHNEHHRRRLSVCQFDLACFASFLYFRILALHLPTMESAAENQVGALRRPCPPSLLLLLLVLLLTHAAAEFRKALGPQATLPDTLAAQGRAHVAHRHPLRLRLTDEWPCRADRCRTKRPWRHGPALYREHQTQTDRP